MNKWQPIETAPQDGTEILAWGDSVQRVVRWESLRRLQGWFININDQGAGTFMISPTHWMPLPEPPHDDDN